MTVIDAPQDRSDTTAAHWIPLHVFYAANPRPLVVDCIGPLARELTAAGLIDKWFYLNYWLEGPHVRVRLLPSSPDAADEVRRRAEEALAGFLHRRPALYEVKSEFLVELYNTLFELEYDPDERARHSDSDGRMIIRPNNSVRAEVYEPEFGKYGGPAGVELAEWHFTRSSELAVEALTRMNMHVRTVMLGVAAELMMVVSSSFIDDRPGLTDYLQRYHDFWHSAFAGKEIIADSGYDKNYDRMAGRVGAKFVELHDAVGAGQLDTIPGFLGEWAEHCVDLRGRVDDLAAAGELTFRSWDDTHDETITEPLYARQRLLSPYMHMTNNRLNATMRDEAYLSYVLARVLRDSLPGEIGTTESRTA